MLHSSSPTKTPAPQVNAEPHVDELAAARKQAEEYLHGWQRARADYANLKRESETRLVEVARYANHELLKECCPWLIILNKRFGPCPKKKRVQLGWKVLGIFRPGCWKFWLIMA